MTIRNLEFLFKPHSVALLGASEQPATPGGVLARNLATGGFAGDRLLVSTESRTIQGLPTYRRPGRLPHAPDLAILTGALADAPRLITELGRLGTRAAARSRSIRRVRGQRALPGRLHCQAQAASGP